MSCVGDCAATITPGRAHCGAVGCHRTFGGVSGFDRHRRNGECLDPAELGMVERGGVWRFPLSPAAAERFYGGV
jgi:hypothetical protein